MKTRCVLPFISIALVLAGCTTAPVPLAKNFPVTDQQVARTAKHWDVVAESIVQQTVNSMNSNPALQKRSLFVPRVYGGGAFDVSFRNFLINHLVNNGMPVSVCRADNSDVDVIYEAQVITHRGLTKYRAGHWTLLGTGVAALLNASGNPSHSDIWATGIGLGAITDVMHNTFPYATNTELIVTTTISENNRFILRRSDIYYVPDGDASLFFERVTQKSACPEDKALVSESQRRDSEASRDARRELFLRDMARSNPQYKP